MSGIRIEHGTAEVELEAREIRSLVSAHAEVYYSEDDLVLATVRALRAVHTDRSLRLADSIEELLAKN